MEKIFIFRRKKFGRIDSSCKPLLIRLLELLFPKNIFLKGPFEWLFLKMNNLIDAAAVTWTRQSNA
jgi:hypothetical protein